MPLVCLAQLDPCRLSPQVENQPAIEIITTQMSANVPQIAFLSATLLYFMMVSKEFVLGARAYQVWWLLTTKLLLIKSKTIITVFCPHVGVCWTQTPFRQLCPWAYYPCSPMLPPQLFKRIHFFTDRRISQKPSLVQQEYPNVMAQGTTMPPVCRISNA